MHRHHSLFLGTAALAVTIAGGLLVSNHAQGQKMQEVKFDLGKNIVETARASGVPAFQTRDIAGLVSYGVTSIPPQIPLRYSRPGYEITWQPVFAMTMYTNKTRDPGLAVQSVDLQLGQRFETHEAAKAFVEQTLAQFTRGKWHRYHDPEWTTLLTGRSSTLNESGQLANPLRNVDPTYKIPMEDWLIAAPRGIIWEWSGDGVLATLTVADMTGSSSSLDYDITLQFDDLAVKLKRDADNEAQRRKEGDAKGWNSTARYEANKKAAQALNRVLEANAIKRGDAVVTTP